MKAYYESHKSDFKIPEKRSSGHHRPGSAEDRCERNPHRCAVQSEYNNRRSDFQMPERVKARHILLKSDASNDAQMKAKAEALLKQIQGGGDFAKLAKENSQDPGSAHRAVNWDGS